MRIEYHRTLIADTHRNAAFHAALAAVIEPGRTTVADIGAGTGLIGLMAARLGAREVYLYEAAEVAGVAAEVLKRNKARNCHLMPCHSTEMFDPPRVDVVVSETLGNYALEEDIIETLNDACERFLNPGGTIIPGRIVQYVAPVTSDRIHCELTAWGRIGYDIDLSFAQTMTLNNAYVRRIGESELLPGREPARSWDSVDLSRRNRPTRSGESIWQDLPDTAVYGFAVWWEAELVPGVVLSTAPGAPPTHWEQLYFPLLRPLKVAMGHRVSFRLRSKSSRETGTDLAWSATLADATGDALDRQSLNLDKGYLP
jgi:precorrin-6B methylase 2